MALISRGINWRKLLDAGDQVRIASALAQLSDDLEDLDARMEGGTNDLNQAQQFPAQDLLERGTQFLTPDLVTSTDGSVTVTPDSFRGTVDLSVPVATTLNSTPFRATGSLSSPGSGYSNFSLTAATDPSGIISGGNINFTATGYAFISWTIICTAIPAGKVTINSSGTLRDATTTTKIGPESQFSYTKDGAGDNDQQGLFTLSGSCVISSPPSHAIAIAVNTNAGAYSYTADVSGFFLST